MRIKKRTKRFLKRLLLAIPVFAVCAFLYLLVRSPSSASPSSIHVDMSPARVERGRYLFTAVCDCDGCHSERDFSRLGGPALVSGRGKGTVMQIDGLPGQIVAENITPDRETGIGAWSDGEKIRAIREGVDKEGRALFPLMPYTSYRAMSDEDVQSLVAYLDTLPPVRNPLPKTRVSFPASMMIKGVPQPVTVAIPRADPYGGAIYGEYLATIAGCEDCHTPLKGNQPDHSMRFAGGRVFSTPVGTVTSSNITSDKQTGIGYWSMPVFLNRIRAWRRYQAEEPPKIDRADFTIMPWLTYSQMSDRDLEALFIYLASIPPISHKVSPH